MKQYLLKMMECETVAWEFIPFITPKSSPVSETILDYAKMINAKIIISSTKSSGQVFGSSENRYEVGSGSRRLFLKKNDSVLELEKGGTSNDLLRNNTTGIPVVIVPIRVANFVS